ncbi:MAG: DNA-3-methyladenine glycosylase, partial [Actinomycetota bacterium]
LEDMARRRSAADPRLLCSGPARLCEALGVARAENGTDLVRGGELWVVPGEPVPSSRIGVTARVGIRDGMDRGWRFLVMGDPFVSRGRPVGGITG